MARCNCAGGSCSCVIQGSGAITVDGAGSETNPYVVSGGGATTVADTPTIHTIIAGTGTADDPYVISAELTATLNDLTDVDTSGGASGYVLAQKSDGTFGLVPAPTASPGLIVSDPTLTGDGSAGAPLAVDPAAIQGMDLSGAYVTQDQFTQMSLLVASLASRMFNVEDHLSVLPRKIWITDVSITPVANKVTSVHIDFPSGYFTARPYVFTNANTSVPGIVDYTAAWNVDQNGCNIAVMRSSGTGTHVFIMVVDTLPSPEPVADVDTIIDGGTP